MLVLFRECNSFSAQVLHRIVGCWCLNCQWKKKRLNLPWEHWIWEKMCGLVLATKVVSNERKPGCLEYMNI